MVAQGMRFQVANWIACGTGLEALEDLKVSLDFARHCRTSCGEDSVELPSMLRRRITSSGQQAFRACYALSDGMRNGRLVFCSRFGELGRTLRILRSICEAEPTSPADFSLSVHNALVGLLSIAWKNPEGHTAISAGPDSFVYGLIESVALLGDGSNEPVLLVYFEDVLSPPYDDDHEASETAVALAVLLMPSSNQQGEIVLTCEPLKHVTLARSASAQCLDFIRFLLSNEHEQGSHSENMEWRWQRCA